MKRLGISFVALVALWLNSAIAQINETKLTASDGEFLNVFGETVSISGEYAIVGAKGKNSAYIFKLEGESWIELAKLTPTDYGNNVFGQSVAISVDYVIVGAPGDNDIPSNGGAVYFYERDSNTDTWIHVAKRTASDGAGQDEFGVAVSIAGDYAIVGSHNDDDKGTNSGSAYIFMRSEGSWTEQAKLTASDGAEEDDFGITVAITVDYAIVGAPVNRGIALNAGAAYIFKRDTTNWTEQDKLTASDGEANDFLGVSVSIDGDYAMVGVTGADGNVVISGAAYVFNRDGESWPEQAKIFASDGASSDIFGGSVSIDGDFVIVGAFSSDGIVPDAGAAYIFHRDGTKWTEKAKLTASDGADGDSFGNSVSISGDRAIVGAFGDDDNGEASGSAYIYNGFSTVVDIEEKISGIPKIFTLEQNFPNPFNPITTIQFTLPKHSKVTLKLYDLLGREIAMLLNNELQPGEYKVNFKAEGLPSGMYFYRIEAQAFSTSSGPRFVKTRKLILLK